MPACRPRANAPCLPACPLRYAPAGKFAPGDWTCTGCGNVNWERRKSCNQCNTPKPGTVDLNREGAGGQAGRLAGRHGTLAGLAGQCQALAGRCGRLAAAGRGCTGRSWPVSSAGGCP